MGSSIDVVFDGMFEDLLPRGQAQKMLDCLWLLMNPHLSPYIACVSLALQAAVDLLIQQAGVSATFIILFSRSHVIFSIHHP